MKLNDLKGKKIIILGFGREGQDTYLALRKIFPNLAIGIADQNSGIKLPQKVLREIKSDKNIKLYFGDNYLSNLKKFDVVIRSPGIPMKKIRKQISKKQKITSQIEIFLDSFPGKVIGVTGTKGKGTASSIIYSVLKRGGIKARLVGNIGKPVLQKLLTAKNDEVYVYEMSSHQLEEIKHSPQIAVFLNIYPAHFDHFGGMANYLKAKENIFAHQKKEDVLIYNAGDKKLSEEIRRKAKSKLIKIKPEKPKFLTEKDISLNGKFNLINISAAAAVGKIFGVSEEKIKMAVKNFKPLPHRLEFVGKHKGIYFYNDSLATVPKSVEAAIGAFGKKIDCLIFGGQKIKGIGFSSLAKKIKKSSIKTIISLPETGKELERLIKKENFNRIKFINVSSMEEAVSAAYNFAGKGKVCLLSPGSPSFNLFKNYNDRGDKFKKFVEFYGKRKNR